MVFIIIMLQNDKQNNVTIRLIWYNNHAYTTCFIYDNHLVMQHVWSNTKLYFRMRWVQDKFDQCCVLIMKYWCSTRVWNAAHCVAWFISSLEDCSDLLWKSAAFANYSSADWPCCLDCRKICLDCPYWNDNLGIPCD